MAEEHCGVERSLREKGAGELRPAVQQWVIFRCFGAKVCFGRKYERDLQWFILYVRCQMSDVRSLRQNYHVYIKMKIYLDLFIRTSHFILNLRS